MGRWAVHTKEVIGQTETAYRYLMEANSLRPPSGSLGKRERSTSTLDETLSKISKGIRGTESFWSATMRRSKAKVDATAADAERLEEWLAEVEPLGG